MELEEAKNKFYKLKTRSDVAEILEIEEKSLRYFLYKIRPENMYVCFNVPKHGGGFREICSPNEKLKTIQKKLSIVLEAVYQPKTCSYGFIKGKDIIQNAKNHTKCELILNIDLKDFFSQIHFGRVRGMMMKPPYNIGIEAATTIAQIACFNGILPQGAPSSPIITNMICASLDNQMMRLAKKTGCVYTRYADDITFSTKKKQFDEEIIVIDNGKVELGHCLAKVLAKNSFKINPDKLVIRKKSNRQEVTGLIVNQFPNIRREYIKQLRAIMFNCSKDGLYYTAQEYVKKGYCNNPQIVGIIRDEKHRIEIEDWFRLVLIGKINYIRQIKGNTHPTFVSFALKYNELTGDNFFDVFQETFEIGNSIKSVFVLESTNNQGTGFTVKELGLFTSYHLTDDDDFYKILLPKSNGEIEQKGVISNTFNLKANNKIIDYALYNVSFANESSLEIGDSDELKKGSEVIIVSFPDYSCGNTVRVEKRRVVEEVNYFGSKLFVIDGIIFHGASGGVVLNKKNKVVGIVKAGIQSLTEPEGFLSNHHHGFIPIKTVLKDIAEQL